MGGESAKAAAHLVWSFLSHGSEECRSTVFRMISGESFWRLFKSGDDFWKMLGCEVIWRLIDCNSDEVYWFEESGALDDIRLWISGDFCYGVREAGIECICGVLPFCHFGLKMRLIQCNFLRYLSEFCEVFVGEKLKVFLRGVIATLEVYEMLDIARRRMFSLELRESLLLENIENNSEFHDEMEVIRNWREKVLGCQAM
jgi:hypothetical protein